MKIGPKMPGGVGHGEVLGPEGGNAIRDAGKPEKAGKFGEIVGPRPAEACGGPAATPGVAVVDDIASRFAAGELTRAEAAREVAAAAVRAWPQGLDTEALRARAVEEMAEILSDDPSFHALLDAAADRSA